MNHRFLQFLFSMLIISSVSSGQIIIKETYRLAGKKYAYYSLSPGPAAKGIVILLPGRGETPKNVFSATSLPGILSTKGYLTIIPELHYSLFADDLIKKQLQEILKIQYERHKFGLSNLSIGGFSAGGAVAISYAEYLVSLDSSNLKSVFVIDPPLDLERVYTTSERWMHYTCNKSISDDGQGTLNYLVKTLGGSPKSKPENYISFSPFLANQPDGGNARWLRKIPVCIYTEPDLDFVKNKFCQELSLDDLNISDLDKLNQFLLKSGNKNSEYIVTKGRGYHSWNIAEPHELANWIIKFGK